MLRALALLLAFLAPAATQISSNLEGTQMSVTRQAGSSVVITCDIKQSSYYLHWYRYKKGMAPQRLLYYEFSSSQVVRESGISSSKYQASLGTRSTGELSIKNLEERDSGVYYCAAWNDWIKTFGKGTKLIVTPSGRRLPADISPKPTIFLPSIAEINLHKAGTYLCLLENFFPDVINVYWKEKNGNTILQSQEGKTMKTKDTYMKFSWLTVTGRSMDKEHRCIVQHEKNRGGVDREILFPPVNEVVSSIVTTIDPTTAYLKDKRKFPAIGSTKASPTEQSEVTAIGSTKASPTEQSAVTSIVTTIHSTKAYPTDESAVTSIVTTIDATKAYPINESIVTSPGPARAYPTEQSVVTAADSMKAFPKEDSEVTAINSTKACRTDGINALQLQLTITSAYYTYVLLLLKSVVYFAIFAFCLLRRTAVFGNGECSNSWWHKEVNFSSFILRKSFS
ncbi:LOW QUALITY PROTEIN: uncharacterized protein LOC131403503 [Diceros bicornis minor]|uniref:LOW QUALITY PROTEIN: uncharacterized protein LOC131403503 n=1 Tax=Diceros bicornis minor TaxID=77932 RepID=UPI0026E94B3B|nr:LOW QUALITY PROTEIN: uncharacterized protein LOC131403503 [Diceros bicornis minor]